MLYQLSYTPRGQERQDSNLRRIHLTDLWSAAFDHSATLPISILFIGVSYNNPVLGTIWLTTTMTHLLKGHAH